MGLRMSRSIKIAPGIRMNIGKNGVGMSVGTNGLRYSINSNGRRTSTIGIPGSGISYSSSSGGSGYSSAKSRAKQLERDRTRANIEQQKQLELEYARAIVDEFNEKMRAIVSIHKECQEVIDWAYIYGKQSPFQKNSQGSREKEVQQELNNYKPGLLNNAFKFLNDPKKDNLIQKLETAKIEDKKEYDEWESLHNIAGKVLSKDIDLMLEVVGELNPFETLVDFGSGFEIGFMDSKTVEVEFDIMSDEVVPFESISLLSSGKVSKKGIPKSKRLDVLQDYVCSCAIKIAREMFAILPLETVIIHAKDKFIDTQVGYEDAKDILSVKFDKITLSALNFKLIDPSDSMANFQCNMKFLKTQGFKPVDRVR